MSLCDCPSCGMRQELCVVRIASDGTIKMGLFTCPYCKKRFRITGKVSFEDRACEKR